VALEVVSVLMEKQDAWLPKLSDMVVVEKNLSYYVPKCVEEFITLVSMMMGKMLFRYS